MTFSCRETVYKLLIDILTCLLIPFSKTMNEKRLCQSLNDLLPHLIQSLEFLVPHKPGLSSSASVSPAPLSVLSSDLHSHQPIKYPGRDSALAEGCLGYEMTSVYIRHRSCLPATHKQYIWQRGGLSRTNGQGYSVSCSDEEGYRRASQWNCALGSVRVIHTLWPQTWSAWLHASGSGLVWKQRNILVIWAPGARTSLQLSMTLC